MADRRVAVLVGNRRAGPVPVVGGENGHVVAPGDLSLGHRVSVYRAAARDVVVQVCRDSQDVQRAGAGRPWQLVGQCHHAVVVWTLTALPAHCIMTRSGWSFGYHFCGESGVPARQLGFGGRHHDPPKAGPNTAGCTFVHRGGELRQVVTAGSITAAERACPEAATAPLRDTPYSAAGTSSRRR